MATVAVTGADGFIGTRVVDELSRRGHVPVPITQALFSSGRLAVLLAPCDAIVHLAAMNRGDDAQIYETNVRLIHELIAAIGARKPHVLLSSSTQQSFDNAYGRSKRDSAALLREWSSHGGKVTIAEIPNVFGDGCRPFYNSVVATFSHQLTHGEEPCVIEDREIELIHVRNLASQIVTMVEHPPAVYDVRVAGDRTLRVTQLLATLRGFETLRAQGVVPDLSDPFTRDLYLTLDSYREYPSREVKPVVHADHRGHLFEIIRNEAAGQVFFSVTKPGVTRGEHYHTRKTERFCVLQGNAVIRLRRVGTFEIVEYRISGPAYVDIPVFHTHNIENVGTTDLLTLFWSSEIYDPRDPDTTPQKVG